MKAVGVTQRVFVEPVHGERRDCLDQTWTKFLCACGLTPVLLPNALEAARALCEIAGVRGLILTGGNDLALFGGDAPERDTVENSLIDMAEKNGLPVLGVCRGMQLIQQRFGVPLCHVEGHVTNRQVIRIGGERKEVNSYHRFAAFSSPPPLDVWAIADDGVIKAIRHSTRPMIGIMWHPERLDPFLPDDLALFRQTFGVE